MNKSLPNSKIDAPAVASETPEEVERTARWLQEWSDRDLATVPSANRAASLGYIAAALLLAQAKQLAAEQRYQLCQRLGFPVRNQTAANSNLLWMINGEYFGATSEAAIDDALAQEGKP